MTDYAHGKFGDFNFSRFGFIMRIDRHIGVIYGVRGVPVPPTFWTEGYRTPTFRDEKVNNLLSSVVNRGDLQILNYTKTVFGLEPAGRA